MWLEPALPLCRWFVFLGTKFKVDFLRVLRRTVWGHFVLWLKFSPGWDLFNLYKLKRVIMTDMFQYYFNLDLKNTAMFILSVNVKFYFTILSSERLNLK